jgi:hypothetical protein
MGTMENAHIFHLYVTVFDRPADTYFTTKSDSMDQSVIKILLTCRIHVYSLGMDKF